MKIQNKIVLIVLFSVVVYGLIALILQYAYLKPEFDQISISLAKKDMEKTLNTITREMEYLNIFTKDYAEWDDTYAYAEHPNLHYTDSNMADSAMINAEISLVGIFDKKMNLLYGKYFEESKTSRNLTIAEYNAIKQVVESSLLTTSGLIEFDNEIYMFSSESINKTDGSGPSNGFLFYGKRLGIVIENLINDNQSFSTQLFSVDETSSGIINGVSEMFKDQNYKQFQDRTGNYQYIVVPQENDFVAGYSFLKGYNGDDIVLIQTLTEKSITILGQKFNYFSAISIAFCGIVIAILMIVFLRYLIIYPIENLSEVVSQFDVISETTGMGDQLTQRTDEIGHLAQKIQAMEEVVLSKHSEIMALNDHLDARIIERTMALQKANETLKLSDVVLNETSEGVVIANANLKIIRVNDAFLSMTGYFREDLLGKHVFALKSNCHDEAYYSEMMKVLRTNDHWMGEYYHSCTVDKTLSTLLQINLIKDATGKTSHFVGLMTDISKLKDNEKELEKLAYFDVLTGLPNRELFYDRLDHSIKRALRTGKISALLFLDLDQFKRINDTMGHAAGDEVLKEVSMRLLTRVRESDTVSRLGGDEFTVILEDIICPENAKAIADDLIGLISLPIQINGHEVTVSASIGISIVPTDDGTVEGLMRKSDAAMYVAKDLGRGRTCFSSDQIEAKNLHYVEMETNLRQALNQNDFQVYLQPKIKWEGHRFVVSGAEALVRWIDKNGQIISPDQFIGLAEETGLINPLGKWILEESCRLSNELQKKGIDLHIGYNLSPKQLERSDLLDEIKAIFQKMAVQPKHIQFEVTESLFFKDFLEASNRLEEIKNLGCSIAIDDFGKGYSSMSYIGNLPVDCLKIDKSFIDSVSLPNEKELVTTFISIAQKNNMKTVAEGVETIEQVRFLLKHGCDELQGYYFSKPLPFEAFLDYISLESNYNNSDFKS